MLDFVSTGGYALKTYDRFRRIVQGLDGLWRVRNAETALRHRLNVGAIVAPAMLIGADRRRGAGRPGARSARSRRAISRCWSAGDTFLFAGQVWRLVAVTGPGRAGHAARPATTPKMPSLGRLQVRPLHLPGAPVRAMMTDAHHWAALPDDVREWLEVQRDRSAIPAADEMLLETFPHGRAPLPRGCYPFEGRLAHTTLAMLLTRRLERLGVGPLGFVCNDYALAIWSLKPMERPRFRRPVRGGHAGRRPGSLAGGERDDEAPFKACALISGLIERRFPGTGEAGRQITFSTDLVYDVLRRHQPDHLLLRCARADAAQGLLDVARLGQLLARIRGRIRHVPPGAPSPFAVPVMLEIGRQRAPGDGAGEMILAESAEALIAEATA